MAGHPDAYEVSLDQLLKAARNVRRHSPADARLVSFAITEARLKGGRLEEHTSPLTRELDRDLLEQGERILYLLTIADIALPGHAAELEAIVRNELDPEPR